MGVDKENIKQENNKSPVTQIDSQIRIVQDKGSHFSIQQILSNQLHRVSLGMSNYQTHQESAVNFKPKSRVQNEISIIQSNLKDILAVVQRSSKDGQISDSINDKMLEILSNFRKIEEQISFSESSQCKRCDSLRLDYEKRINEMSDHYQRLRVTMDSLQEKMTILVQENSKLKKNIIEQGSDQDKRSTQNLDLQSECQRLHQCLKSNQLENDELKIRIKLLEDSKQETICRQLFQNEDTAREQRQKVLAFQAESEQLQKKLNSLSNLLVEKDDKLEICQKELLKYQKLLEDDSRIYRSDNKSPAPKPTNTKTEQLELKVFQLQIENDNMKSEMAHQQVDFKAMENKTQMIGKLEERIKQLLREKGDIEDEKENLSMKLKTAQQESTNQQLDISELKDCLRKVDKEFTTVKQKLSEKDAEMNVMIKVRQDLENDQRKQSQEFQLIRMQLEDRLGDLMHQIKKYEDSLRLQEQRNGQLQDELKKQEKLSDQLKVEFERLKQEDKKLIEKNQSQKQQIDSMSHSIEQQSQLQQSLLLQLDTYKNVENQLKQELDRMDELYRQQLTKQEHEFQKQKAEFKSQLNELQEQSINYASKLNEKDQQLHDMRIKINIVIEENRDLKTHIESQKAYYQDHFVDMERQMKASKQLYDELLTSKEREHAELAEQRIQLENQLKLNERRLNNMSLEFEQREKEIFNEKHEFESIKSELEKTRNANYNLQEELLKAGMLISQYQTTQHGMKTELQQSRNEQQNLIDLLRKRKEETEQLHQALEESRKESLKLKSGDDGRSKGTWSILQQQDLQSVVDNLQRQNSALQLKVNSLNTDVTKKQRELIEKTEEANHLRRKLESSSSSLQLK